MSWYYAIEGKQAGPVTDEQFNSLVNTGAISGSTLVWREGMTQWQPYSTLAGAPAAALAPGAIPAQADAGTVLCAECRQPFPPEHTVRFGDVAVCGNCKPIYLQKLREGAVTADAVAFTRYGGFWIRVLAKVVDSIIVGIPVMLLIFLGGAGLGIFSGTAQPANSPAAAFSMLGLQLGLQAIGILVGAVYNIYFVSKHQATPGKMILGLRIVNADGTRVSTAKATGRFFAEMLSGMTCYIGYIIAGFDKEKRTLHDHICSTRVVYKAR